jgi:hypothetical protein
MAKKNGIKFHLIDLRPDAVPQINPLFECKLWQVEDIFISAFELGKSGDAAVDFHRGEDRDAVLEVTRLFGDGANSIPALFKVCSNNSTITQRTNFWREFRHLCSLPAFHAKEGLNLKNAISNGDIIYIIGSTTSDRVYAAQRLILQRILQIIAERNREGTRHVALMLDELKYVLSVPILRAMGTIRDRRCHLIVAHQSINDLQDCGGLDSKAVTGAIHGNTTIKIVYQLNEFQSAMEFEGLGGTERTFTENISTRDDTHSKGWRESERPRVRADILTHLPKPTKGESSAGILFGLGPARLISTRFLQSGTVPKAVPAEPDYEKTGGGTVSIEGLI